MQISIRDFNISVASAAGVDLGARAADRFAIDRGTDDPGGRARERASSLGRRQQYAVCDDRGKGVGAGYVEELDVSASLAARKLSSVARRGDYSKHPLFKVIDGVSCIEAVRTLLDAMTSGRQINGRRMPMPSSQTFCIAASTFQFGPTDADKALELFRNATNAGVPADGRFVNAVFRCFGNDINAALSAWKDEIRIACLRHEGRTRSTPVPDWRTKGKNLIAAYNGLIHVCGRAVRPDIALRLIYAMNKEGLEPNEISLNCYRPETDSYILFPAR